MKKKIRNWLGIEKDLEQLRSEIPDIPAVIPPTKEQISDWIASYTKTECQNCNKKIYAHFGGFYKDWEGRVFCSHKCIDDYKRKGK